MIDQSLIIVFFFQYYNGDNRDLNSDFPAGQPGGVSSAIVQGGQFDAFSKVDWGGINSRLVTGQYKNPAQMNFAGDTMQSIQKV